MADFVSRAAARVAAILSIAILGTAFGAEVVFQHPSVISTQEQLDLMARRVNADGPSINKGSYEKLRKQPYASPDYQPTPMAVVHFVPSGTGPEEEAYRRDSQAARAAALQWVVTGDARYRDQAKAILNDWAKTLTSVVNPDGSSARQVNLETAWGLPTWISAADIIRYHKKGAAGWTAGEIAQFDSFINLQYQWAEKAANNTGNWGASGALAMICTGVYQNDAVRFQAGVAKFKDNLTKSSKPDGEIAEVCRDTWHPQYSIIAWMQACEVAWHQGLDLYELKLDGQSTPRLIVILQYFSELYVEKRKPPCAVNWKHNYRGKQTQNNALDIGYNHYVRRMGRKDLPVLSDVVEHHYRPSPDDAHFLCWGTLTHGDTSPKAAPK